ncbi:hypothetical protein Tsubulata_023076 [Turnera subulata]|uniref:RING-type domain-containing protein n=1 Tax=Turnera subulata TaxID=218843 RepID=A0A9Q0JH58_9ROSI|nr:hypothetical protein Tsubulata_023076 [Turnera subulata]
MVDDAAASGCSRHFTNSHICLPTTTREMPEAMTEAEKKFVRAVFSDYPFALRLFWVVDIALAGMSAMLALRFHQRPQLGRWLAFFSRVFVTYFVFMTPYYFVSDGFAAAGERLVMLGHDKRFMGMLFVCSCSFVISEIYMAWFSDSNPHSSEPSSQSTSTAETVCPICLRTCTICLRNPKDMAFGCGHTTCMECGASISTCPLCRQPITIRLRLYD